MFRTARTNRDVVNLALAGFDTRTSNGNMSADQYRAGFTRYAAPYVGHLPRAWQGVLHDAFRAGRIETVIYSYSTPIAWKDSQYGWIVPDVSYSITTSSKHQSQLWALRTERRITLPWDASPEEAQRVMDGLMSFTTNASGKFTGTVPGPNYTIGE